MIVVDASVGAKWIFPEQHSDLALALVEWAARDRISMASPPLIRFEITSVVCKRVRKPTGGIALGDGITALDAFFEFPVDLYAPRDLNERALTLAVGYGFGIYDAHYVALAQSLGCDLWTADDGILDKARGRLPFVKDLATFIAPPDETW